MDNRFVFSVLVPKNLALDKDKDLCLMIPQYGCYPTSIAELCKTKFSDYLIRQPDQI